MIFGSLTALVDDAIATYILGTISVIILVLAIYKYFKN